MKKLLALLTCLSVNSMLSYTWTIKNDTDGEVFVTLLVRSGADYNRTLAAGETWKQNVMGYCIKDVKAHGLSGSVKNKDATVRSPGIFGTSSSKISGLGCGNYTVWISSDRGNLNIAVH